MLLPTYIESLWLKSVPHAHVMRIADAGHFVQEDAHERLVPELMRFLGRLQ